MSINFPISSSNIKGVRKIRDQLDVLIKRLRNRAVEVSTLTTDKVTINKESDDNSDAVLDVLGNIVINGDVSGDVNFSGNIRFDSSYGILLPRGDISSAQGIDEGTIRYNTEDNIFEGFSLGDWRGLGGVRSVDGETIL